MLADDGLVKILDFGLARRLRGSPAPVSDDTAELGLAELGNGLFGTPRYLSPEQARGEPSTTASDLFSLGVIFFELATGRPAFPGPGLLQILDQIRSVEPTSFAEQVPGPFDILIRALLIPDAVRRTITMREVADVLAGPPDAGPPPLAPHSPPLAP
jgi:serine/threonine-protein kinase